MIDTVDLHAAAWSETFRHFGVNVREEDVRGQIGKGGDNLMPVFLDQPLIDAKGKEIEKYRTNLFREKYFPKAKPFPKVKDLFTALRQRSRKIALASSCKADELKDYTHLAGIDGIYDVATTADDVERSKPQPDVFQVVLKKLSSLGASDVIAVGDAPYDAQAAGKTGIRTIGVRCGGFAEEDLLKSGCISIYSDPADLLENLDAVLHKPS